MYNAALLAHSWLRWVVILLGLAVVIRSATRTSGLMPWNHVDERNGRLFVAALDLQFLIGLLLYWVWSPFVKLAMSDVAGAMRDGDLRFWLVEHATGMVIALVLAHVGRVRVRRAPGNADKHRATAMFMGIAVAVILLSIPWPGLPSARPLFRF